METVDSPNWQSTILPQNVTSEVAAACKPVDGRYNAAISERKLSLALAASTDVERPDKPWSLDDTRTARQRVQHLEQSIDFLRLQHQELVSHLHDEIERLKRKNGGVPRPGIENAKGAASCVTDDAQDFDKKKLEEYKVMFLESEMRDLQKLLNEERTQNQQLSQKLQLTERQLAVERLKPKQDVTKSSSAAGARGDPENSDDLDSSNQPQSTGLPFSATVEPLLVHIAPRPPRVPTIPECQAIVKHLYTTNTQLAHELKQLKLDLRDVLYSHKWTPDAFLLARAYIADEEDRPLNISHSFMPMPSSLPRIPLSHATKKVPEAAYQVKDIVLLPPMKNAVGNPAIERQKRTRHLQKMKTVRQ